jgi:putative membrane protein
MLRYLHFIAIAFLAGALIIENMAISRKLSREDITNLVKVDAVYGLSAAAVFIIGLVLWRWVGKGAAFYSDNPLFQFKLLLFVVIALLSVFPTVFLLRHRKTAIESIEVPTLLIWLLRLELLLLVFIPVLAALMARGIGLS